MPGRNLPFPVAPIITKNEKTGDKIIHFVEKREIKDPQVMKTSLSEIKDPQGMTTPFNEIIHHGKLASIFMNFMNLWMKCLASNSKDCQRFHICRVNDQIGESYGNFVRKRALVKYQSQSAVIEAMLCFTIF